MIYGHDMTRKIEESFFVYIFQSCVAVPCYSNTVLEKTRNVLLSISTTLVKVWCHITEDTTWHTGLVAMGKAMETAWKFG